MEVPSNIKTFPDMVAWLIEAQHKGNASAMARKLKVSTGLIWHWREGLVKQPSQASLERLAKAYGLDIWAVYARVVRMPLPIGGGSSADGTLLLVSPWSAITSYQTLVASWLRSRWGSLSGWSGLGAPAWCAA